MQPICYFIRGIIEFDLKIVSDFFLTNKLISKYKFMNQDERIAENRKKLEQKFGKVKRMGGKGSSRIV